MLQLHLTVSFTFFTIIKLIILTGMNLAILSVYIWQNNPAKFATLPSVFSVSAQKGILKYIQWKKIWLASMLLILPCFWNILSPVSVKFVITLKILFYKRHTSFVYVLHLRFYTVWIKFYKVRFFLDLKLKKQEKNEFNQTDGLLNGQK